MPGHIFMILVTGSSGRVGSSLVAALLKRKERVRTLERREGAKLEGVEMIQGDILDADTVKRAMESVDVVYHMAAIVDYHPVPNDIMYKVNVVGTKTLLEHSNAKKFIYLSSTGVYGKNMKENPANENTAFNPHSFYGKTKMMAEKMVMEKGGVVIRSPPIFGPGFDEGFDFVLSQLEKGKMQLIGNGENQIQWIHISDLIEALLLAKDRGKPGEAYLVGGKEIMTQRELLSLLAKYLKVESPKKKIPKTVAKTLAYYKMFEARMTGRKPRLVPEHITRITDNRTFDISKARRELGFEPKVGYEKAAKEIVEDYLRNKDKAEHQRL
jgi:2-alkyl-3-oxoalkanoate reductase